MLTAQRHLRTEIGFNKSAVYIGEPIEVSVTIYSSTWFTEGIDPGNVKINGAYTVYFRSLSNSKKIDGQLYSGVTLYYNVFPYNEEDVVFPSLEFSVVTPDNGGYEGVKRYVKTRARTIKVKPIPPGIDKDSWLVSSSVRVYDNWKGDLSKVKVGDVLERTITLKVGNTISEFIPKIHWDTIQNISLYPKRPYLKNNKSKTAISAERVDSNRFLFEKEGAYTIPEIVIQWWNPVYKRMYKRVLKEKVIHVAANPDLGMLESVKERLEASVETEKKEDEFVILGMSVKRFVSLLLGTVLLLFLIGKLGLKLLTYFKRRKIAYRKSEMYFFTLFLKETRQDLVQARVYKWVDQLTLEEYSLNYFITNYGSDILKLEFSSAVLNGHSIDAIFTLKKEWTLSRLNYIKAKKNRNTKHNDWVNP